MRRYGRILAICLVLVVGSRAPAFLVPVQPVHAQAVDNFVWVTNHDSDTVSKIDKITTSVVATIPVGDGPFGVAVDPEFVWVANQFSNTVSKISKTTSSVVDTIPVDVTGFQPGVTPAIAVDADSVWVVSRNINSDNSGRISKIDKSTGSVVATINLGGNMVAVDKSSVWVTQHFPGTVLKIDKATAMVVATIPLGFGPQGVKADDSNVWVPMRNDQLVRIDKSTNSVTMIFVGGLPAHVAFDENAVWVTGVCCEGMPIIPGTVYKVNRFTATVETTIPLNNAGGVAVDKDFVWATNFREVNTLSKISKSTNSVVATTPVGGHPAMVGDGTGFAYDFFFAPDFSISNSGGIAVVQTGSGSNVIAVTLLTGVSQVVSLTCTSGLPAGASCSFNPASGFPTFSSTLTITTSQTTPTGSFTVTVTGTGGGATHTTSFTLSVSQSSMTRVGALTLNLGEFGVLPAVIDSANGFAYFGSNNIVKIRLSDFTRVGALSLTGTCCLSSAVIDTVNGFAYFGTNLPLGTTRPDDVVKIRLSDFTQVGTLTLNPGENRLITAVIDPANSFAYFGTGSGAVVKIRLSDFTRVGALTLNPVDLTSSVIDTSNGFAYFGLNTAPGTIAQVRLSDFTHVGTLTLTGENPRGTAIIDTTHGFAYFGEGGSQNMRSDVAKIRLSDFTHVGTLDLDPGETGLRSSVIDSASGFAYFGTLTSPGIVVKIRLSDFTRVGALTLYPGEDSLISAVIDTDSGFAYFGTLTTPGIIVKIGLFDFSLSNSGGISVVQGGSGSNAIIVTLSGASQSVSLSCSGLPSGASCSFNPSSGFPTFSTTLTISTLFSTPTGSYTITVTGTGGGQTHATQFILTVAFSGGGGGGGRVYLV